MPGCALCLLERRQFDAHTSAQTKAPQTQRTMLCHQSKTPLLLLQRVTLALESQPERSKAPSLSHTHYALSRGGIPQSEFSESALASFQHAADTTTTRQPHSKSENLSAAVHFSTSYLLLLLRVCTSSVGAQEGPQLNRGHAGQNRHFSLSLLGSRISKRIRFPPRIEEEGRTESKRTSTDAKISPPTELRKRAERGRRFPSAIPINGNPFWLLEKLRSPSLSVSRSDSGGQIGGKISPFQ